MRQAHFVKSFLFLASAGFAAAQVTIGAVVNAGSRIQSASPFYGIAQGSLFAITGKGLGPDQLRQASFPLPTTDGLGGITVQANNGATASKPITVVAAAFGIFTQTPTTGAAQALAFNVNWDGSWKRREKNILAQRGAVWESASML
jgi:hypothetical protein